MLQLQGTAGAQALSLHVWAPSPQAVKCHLRLHSWSSVQLNMKPVLLIPQRWLFPNHSDTMICCVRRTVFSGEGRGSTLPFISFLGLHVPLSSPANHPSSLHHFLGAFHTLTQSVGQFPVCVVLFPVGFKEHASHTSKVQ